MKCCTLLIKHGPSFYFKKLENQEHIKTSISRRKNSYEVSKEKRMWVGRLKDLITYGWQIKN